MALTTRVSEHPSRDTRSILGRILGNTGAQAAADIFGKLAVLVTYALVARDLGAVPLGQLTLALSIAVLMQLGGLGTDPLIAREVARDRARLPELLWNVLGLKLALGGLIALAVVLAALLGDFGPELRLLLILMAVSGVIDLAATTLAWVLRGLEEMVPVAKSLFVQRLVMAVLAIAALLILDGGIVLVGAAYLIGSVAGAGFLIVQLTRRHLWAAAHFSAVRARSIAVESLPLAATAFLSTALARFDTLLLAALSTLAVVGMYGAAYRLIESTFFIGWAFGTALFPMLSRLGPDTRPTLARVFEVGARVSLAGMLPVGAVFILFPAPLIELVYGPAFGAAIEPTRWLGIVAALNGVASLAMFALAARNLRRPILWICAAALTVNVVLNVALIPSYGATGAAIAMAAANVVLGLAGLWVAARNIGPVSIVRLGSLTTIAFAAMASARFLLGESWLGLVAGLVAYGGVLMIAHHQLFGHDTRLVLTWFRHRSSTPGEKGY